MTQPDHDAVLHAIRQRLRACAAVLLDTPPPVDADPSRDAAIVLEALVASVAGDPDGGRLWLLVIAVRAAYPTCEEVEEARRRLEMGSPTDFTLWLLRDSLEDNVVSGAPTPELEIVDANPVIDVHFSARFDLTSGIQRVVRETISRWAGVHDLTLVAWTDDGRAMRSLSPCERDRLLGTVLTPTAAPETSAGPARIVVPWRVPVVLCEVPPLEHSEALVALAEHSASPVVAIGYDAIPLVSPEFVSVYEHRKFVKYLAVIKRAQSVVAIGESSAAEFRGFNAMLAAQGLSGPTVTSCPLPNYVAPPSPPAHELDTEMPTVLCVGSLDRRKNQLGLVHAAEVLWREGRAFALRLIGSGGLAPAELLSGIDELRQKGRPISAEVGVSDRTLSEAYQSARFSVFPSLHEGFGLPVGESLSYGTPVIASGIGSIIECTRDGGILLIDPRQDGSLVDAMRQLLDDDELLERLRTEALARPRRTWDQYATELWSAVAEVGAS